MDNVLSSLIAFPPHPPPNPPLTDAEYDKQARKFVDGLQKSNPQNFRGGKKDEDLLNILNPAINSISYLHVLQAHIIVSSTKTRGISISDHFAPGHPLWRKAVEFVEQFDPVQIRYSGHELRQLVEVFDRIAMVTGQADAAIYPVRTAILRLDPTGATFTSLHQFLPRLCLLAGDYAGAFPLLDKDIFHFPAMTVKAAELTADPLSPYLCSVHEKSCNYIHSASGLTAKLEYQDHMRYYLYGAMCYMALKDWARALLFLEVVLMSPTTNIASVLQVHAYKKWILVSLLRHGKTISVPKTTNSQGLRHFQNISRPYVCIAEVFQKTLGMEESSAKLVAEIHEAQSILTEDCNMGLANQVIDSYRYFTTLNLGKTYAALPIPTIAAQTSHVPNDHAETGQYLYHLITTNKLNGTISQPSQDPSTWVLRFHDPTDEGPQAPTEQQRHDELARQMAKIQQLHTHIKEVDRKFGLSKEYIAEKKRAGKKQENGGNTFEESWLPPEQAFEHDEDVMRD